MPLSVNFRWKTPALATPQSDAEKSNLNENLMQLGDAISRMRASRYNKAQTTRRNAIEDENRAIAAEDRAIAAEDRAREIDEQERRKKAYGEAADIMRGRSAERERLLQERASIVAQINGLKQRMGL
jgi:hypothetical protein